MIKLEGNLLVTKIKMHVSFPEPQKFHLILLSFCSHYMPNYTRSKQVRNELSNISLTYLTLEHFSGKAFPVTIIQWNILGGIADLESK